jgi:hypothetical protein
MKILRVAFVALVTFAPFAWASADEAMKTSHRHAAPHTDMAMRADASRLDASHGAVDAAVADWHKNFGF